MRSSKHSATDARPQSSAPCCYTDSQKLLVDAVGGEIPIGDNNLPEILNFFQKFSRTESHLTPEEPEALI